MAVIPGPPAILSRELTDAKLRRVKRILCGARHVWAYSPELKTFCDGLIGCGAGHRHSLALRSGGHAEAGARARAATLASTRFWCRRR